MPLTPSEEIELAQLEKSRLSPDEERELAHLQQSQRGFDDMGSEVSNAKERANQQALPGRLGTGILAGSGIATGGAGLMTSIPAVTAASLAKQKLQGQPMSMGQTAVDVGLNSVVPAGLSKLGKLLGIGADKAQQVAMGMKKYSPGAGTEAIENGVWGTKTGMQSAMKNALESQGSKLDKMVGSIKGDVDAESVANRVANYGQKYISPSGYSTDAGFERAQDAFQRGSDIYQRGNMSMPDANQVAKTAYNIEGFSPMNTPKLNYNSQLAREEAGEIRDQIKSAGAAQGIPIETQYKTLSNLLKGNKALNSPDSINLNNPLSSVTKALLKETVARPEVMSYGAARANDASKMIKASPAAPASLFQLLMKHPGEE